MWVVETVREKPKDGFLTMAEQEANGTRPSLPFPESCGSPSGDSSQTYSPYGQWKAVEDTSLQMPDLQLPADEAEEEQEVYQPLSQEEQEFKFEEKVVDKKISTGTDTFKKRQVKPGTKRNVRRRESSP